MYGGAGYAEIEYAGVLDLTVVVAPPSAPVRTRIYTATADKFKARRVMFTNKTGNLTKKLLE